VIGVVSTEDHAMDPVHSCSILVWAVILTRYKLEALSVPATALFDSVQNLLEIQSRQLLLLLVYVWIVAGEAGNCS
jgi:hypothetical protein